MSTIAFILMLAAGAETQDLPAEVLWDNNLAIDLQSLFPISPPGAGQLRWVDDIHVGPGGWLITNYDYNGFEQDGWLHSGFNEVYVASGASGAPSEFVMIRSGPHERIATGEMPFGRDGYDYRVRELRILLPPGAYWIGVRDAGGSGQGTSAIASSDGGSDGGCSPDYPEGSCTSNYFSTDSGHSWQPSPEFEHFAFLLQGVRAPGDFNGDDDVDLVDFAAFNNCVTGPGEAANISCRVFDFDNDEDVDFTDFQVMQIVFAWE